jgi:multidrug efflux pump subunit AcrB
MLGEGLNLRFHIENTSEAMADEARGSLWLLGSAMLLAGAAGASLWSKAPRWFAVLIALPVIVGILPALLMPGNIIPFGTAVLSGLVAVVGLTATVLSAARR